MTETEKAIVESWAIRSWNEKQFLHFGHLHINKICHDWGDPAMWLRAGAECLTALDRILTRERMPLWGAVAFSLRSGGASFGVNFHSRDELLEQFGDAPPSLYLFQPMQAAWLDTPKEPLHVTFLFDVAPHVSWFYSEYKDDSDPDYRRALWATKGG